MARSSRPLIGAIIFAGVLTFAFIQLQNGDDKKKKSEEVSVPESVELQVLSSNTNLNIGQKIREKDLQWKTIDEKDSKEEYIVQGKESLESFIGVLVRKPIKAGQPLTEDQIVRLGKSGLLAGLLKPGMRAVSIEVNPSTGVAGLISPGDRVDILLTHVVGEDKKNFVSKKILSHVLVLALDQSVSHNKDDQAIVAETVTLEVTPKQAQIIAVARSLGELSLSLKSVNIGGVPDEGTDITTKEDITSVVNGTVTLPTKEKKKTTHTITIIKGDKQQTITLEAE